MSFPSSKVFILLDTNLNFAETAHCVAHWSSRVVPDGHYSIPALVDRNAPTLRQNYFNWVYDLGNYKIHGQPLKTYLGLLDGLSFWWLTLIAEKEPRKSPSIYKVFKLRVLEQLYLELGCNGLVYKGSDLILHRVLKDWCNKLGHTYEWHSTGFSSSDPVPLRQRIIGILPQALLATLYFSRNWWQRYRLVNSFVPSARSSLPEVTIVTYFPNVDKSKIAKGEFLSHYWNELHIVLDEQPILVNWVWLHVDRGEFSFEETLSLLDVCNKRDPQKHRFFLVEQFVTPKILLKALAGYAQVVWKGISLNPIKKMFCFSGSSLNFFPILQYDWESSFYGTAAIEGLLYALIFDEMARYLPANPWGMFVWENQPWELALTSAWRRHGKENRIIAYQHSTIRFLDLRMLSDERDYEDPTSESRPMPDVLTVNGRGAQSLLLNCGFPKERLVLVEALRYLNLNQRILKPPNGSPKTLLVLGEYQKAEMIWQLSLLNQAALENGLDGFERILIKPHPFCPLDSILKANPLSFTYELVNEPLSVLWGQADAAFVGNSTGVVLEAMYCTVPVAVCASVDGMNLSPAFLQLDIPMITSTKELKKFLAVLPKPHTPEDYFILDLSLKRWRDLLTYQKGNSL